MSMDEQTQKVQVPYEPWVPRDVVSRGVRVEDNRVVGADIELPRGGVHERIQSAHTAASGIEHELQQLRAALGPILGAEQTDIAAAVRENVVPECDLAATADSLTNHLLYLRDMIETLRYRLRL